MKVKVKAVTSPLLPKCSATYFNFSTISVARQARQKPVLGLYVQTKGGTKSRRKQKKKMGKNPERLGGDSDIN